MALAPDLVGTQSEPLSFVWERDDILLYAVAVGAGNPDPVQELALTTENTEGVRTIVLPTYANIITRGARVPLGDYDPSKLVHAEQWFRVHRPIPVAGRARITATVTDVLDKVTGAMIRTETRAVDADTGAPLATTAQTVFIRGEGGFGGPRGESTGSPIPHREPDHVVHCATRPEQALLYRLTGDRNPLHSDPAFAARGGFDRPILHGMCTYGFTARALLATVCDGDPARFAAMDARFTRPVFPGDELTVEVWADGAAAYFRTKRGDEVVLDRGRLELSGD